MLVYQEGYSFWIPRVQLHSNITDPEAGALPLNLGLYETPSFNKRKGIWSGVMHPGGGGGFGGCGNQKWTHPREKLPTWSLT